MKYAIILLLACYQFSGCSAIDPAIIEALSKDPASVCITGDIRGGAGGIIGGATGGYGQSTLSYCRAAQPGAKVTLSPTGEITIEHSK